MFSSQSVQQSVQQGPGGPTDERSSCGLPLEKAVTHAAHPASKQEDQGERNPSLDSKVQAMCKNWICKTSCSLSTAFPYFNHFVSLFSVRFMLHLCDSLVKALCVPVCTLPWITPHYSASHFPPCEAVSLLLFATFLPAEDNWTETEAIWVKYILRDLSVLTKATGAPPTPNASSWDWLPGNAGWLG